MKAIPMKALRVLPALALAVAVAGPARADTTPDAAVALQTQLHDWLASLLQPAVIVAPDAVKVAPEGDHFRLGVPEPLALIGMGLADAGTLFSLSVRPMEAGRWALDDLHLPAPMRVTGPALPAAPGGAPAAPAPGVMELTLDGLQFHGVLDPSFTTTSSFDASFAGAHATGPQATLTYGKSTGNSILQPDGEGRITVTSKADIGEMRQTADMPDGSHYTLTIGRGHFETAVKKVSPADLAALMRSISAFVPTAAGTGDSLSPAQRTLARNFVRTLRNLSESASLSDTLDGLSVDLGGMGASLRRLTMGGDIGAPDGIFSFGLQFGLEGLDSPMIPPGIYHDYLPRKIGLKSRVSGLKMDDLQTLALHAVDTDEKTMPALQGEAMALLASGPLNVSLEAFSFDLGPASLEGNLSIDIASPTDITGDGDITVTGLDALIKRANTTPELKQIAPVLIFLKGIGKQDGNETSFAISYENGSLKVNDTDLSSMMPGNTKP